MRELAWAARGRQGAEWAQTAELLAAVINLFRQPGDRVEAAALNPYAEARPRKAELTPQESKAGWASLKALFFSGGFR